MQAIPDRSSAPGRPVAAASAFPPTGLRELAALGRGVLHEPYSIGELARRVRAALDKEMAHDH
jgi:hypothetical protein